MPFRSSRFCAFDLTADTAEGIEQEGASAGPVGAYRHTDKLARFVQRLKRASRSRRC